MIPKLASHILHQTSRAAATAQNYTFRNVLGFQSPSTASGGLGSWSGAGSSSWGSYGAGPGGAKYSSGSRFYSGYQVSFFLSIAFHVFEHLSIECWSCSHAGQLGNVSGSSSKPNGRRRGIALFSSRSSDNPVANTCKEQLVVSLWHWEVKAGGFIGRAQDGSIAPGSSKTCPRACSSQ